MDAAGTNFLMVYTIQVSILKPNFNSLAEKAQPYQRPNFLGTTPCGAGRRSLKRSMSENRGMALIVGVQGSEMPSSTQKGTTPWPSRSS